MKLHAVEGNRLRLDGGAMFGNAPKPLWQRWTQTDEQNRIPLASRALLVQLEDGRNILFETGVGVFFEPKLKERYAIDQPRHVLLDNLQALNITENDIDAVVLSHLHFDHAGGLLSSYGEGPPRLLFPRAVYYTGKQHWENALKPHMREQVSFIPELHKLLAASGRLVLIEGPDHPSLDFDMTFHYSHGHTIGLMLAELATGHGPLLFCSDLVPGVPWVHLPITMGYDRYAELLVNEKQKLLESLHERNGRLFFTHDPEVSLAVLKRDPSGKFIC